MEYLKESVYHVTGHAEILRRASKISRVPSTAKGSHVSLIREARIPAFTGLVEPIIALAGVSNRGVTWLAISVVTKGLPDRANISTETDPDVLKTVGFRWIRSSPR